MLEFLMAPENLPFAVALLLMLMIGAVEAVGLGFGSHLDLHSGDADLLGWLGVGQVPVLMLLVVFLALFGIIGITLQQIVAAFAGVPMAPLNASAIAAVASLPLLGISARGLARIMPQDETTAVSLDSLVAKRATVTVGTARRGSPARAQVRDAYGQTHYVMIEPAGEDQSIATGETALLVRREGDIFIGLAEGDALLPRLDEHPALRS
jgi:hypothetical protein